MNTFLQSDLENLEKRYRSNLINSVSGYKSAHLVGTSDSKGTSNLAVFSSIIHIGATPPLLGFIMRPTHVERHTYENLIETGKFTVNAIARNMEERAHQTSAKYDRATSEFEACGFESEYLGEFAIPFVKESPIKIACTFQEEIPIQVNNTRLIIGNIVAIHLRENLLLDDGNLELSNAAIVAINGLEAYHPVGVSKRFAYARPDKPIFEK